jgi:hypothetical protein
MSHRSAAFLLISALTVGCSSKSTIDCATNADCLQGGIGGMCRPSPASAQRWCSFPDPGCPGTGERWGVASGDGLAGECVAGITDDGGAPDGGPPDAAIPTDFAFRFGGVTDENLIKSLPLSDGSTVLVTWFQGTVTIAGTVLTSRGMGDFHVARVARDGTVLWLNRFGGEGDERPVDVQVDQHDSIVILGEFTGTTDLGGGPSGAQGKDLFLLKIDSAGHFIWSKTYGALADEAPTGLALNGSGDIFVVGSFDGLTDLGEGALNSAGVADLFLARYAGIDGRPQWTERIGSTGTELSTAIAASGPNVAISGQLFNHVNLGGGEQTLATGGAYVASYSAANGIYAWSHVLVSQSLLSPLRPSNLVLLHDGSVVTSIDFSGPVDFGAGEVDSAHGDFLGHYRVGGSLDWSRVATTGGVIYQALAVDAHDNLWSAGAFGGTVDFGMDQLTSTEVNHTDLFLAGFAPNGEPLHAVRFASPGGSEAVLSLAASPQLVMSGSFLGDLTLENGDVLSSAGGFDSFVIGRVLP